MRMPTQGFQEPGPGSRTEREFKVYDRFSKDEENIIEEADPKELDELFEKIKKRADSITDNDERFEYLDFLNNELFDIGISSDEQWRDLGSMLEEIKSHLDKPRREAEDAQSDENEPIVSNEGVEDLAQGSKDEGVEEMKKVKQRMANLEKKIANIRAFQERLRSLFEDLPDEEGGDEDHAAAFKRSVLAAEEQATRSTALSKLRNWIGRMTGQQE